MAVGGMYSISSKSSGALDVVLGDTAAGPWSSMLPSLTSQGLPFTAGVSNKLCGMRRRVRVALGNDLAEGGVRSWTC